MARFMRSPVTRAVTVVLVAVATTSLELAASTAPARAGAFPGRNGLIAFDSDVNGCCNIFTVRPDGTHLRQLTRQGFNADPDWSARADLIAFDRDLGRGSNIWVMRPDGTHLRRVTTSGCDAYPSFAPDGRRIVAVHWPGRYPDCFGNNPDLFIVRRDGTGRRRLTHTPNLRELSPEWSPDGRRIAYDVHTDGNPDFSIRTIRPDGTGTQHVTPEGVTSLFPDWSPDGRWIVYSAYINHFRIFRVHRDGSGRVPLTNAPALLDDLYPAFSPDGRRIAFVSDRHRDDRFGLFEMGSDGSNVRMVLTHDQAGFVADVDWGSSRAAAAADAQGAAPSTRTARAGRTPARWNVATLLAKMLRHD